jgi:hypothetical protein
LENTLGNLRNTDKHNWEHEKSKKMIELHTGPSSSLKRKKKDGPLKLSHLIGGLKII